MREGNGVVCPKCALFPGGIGGGEGGYRISKKSGGKLSEAWEPFSLLWLKGKSPLGEVITASTIFSRLRERNAVIKNANLWSADISAITVTGDHQPLEILYMSAKGSYTK